MLGPGTHRDDREYVTMSDTQLAIAITGAGGAGVISGAIAGGIILGFMEAIGLAVLSQYGDITYLLIFVSLMIFLAFRPQGLMGKPWG